MPSAIIRPVNWGKRTCQPCLKCSKSSGGCRPPAWGAAASSGSVDHPADEPRRSPARSGRPFRREGSSAQLSGCGLHEGVDRAICGASSTSSTSAATSRSQPRPSRASNCSTTSRPRSAACRRRCGGRCVRRMRSRRGAEAVAGGEPRQGAEGREAR